MNESILPTTNDTNPNDENQVNLDEDEEELRRLDNIDNLYIPFTTNNQSNEKDKQQINKEQLEYMQRLLNNRTALLSDDQVKSFKDLWLNSIDKEQRQALYRYWLWKYIQYLTGNRRLTESFLYLILFF
jgi:hypothetical protein